MLLKTADVAKLLNVSPRCVCQVRGEIGFVRIGRSVRFRPEDIDRYIAAQRVTWSARQPSVYLQEVSKRSR